MTAPMTPATVGDVPEPPPPPPVIPPASPPANPSWVSEVTNPHFWLSLVAYVPTVWAWFHLPTSKEATAVAVLQGISLVIGPLATAVYIIMHARKTVAHESRLAEVEKTAIAVYGELTRTAGTDLATPEAGIKRVLETLHPSA